MKRSPLALLGAIFLISCTSTHAQHPEGVWVSEVETIQLTLEPDGTFGGFDGCNTLFGDWIIEQRTLTFSNIGATEVACPDIETWLNFLDKANIEDDAMHILDISGTEVGVLKRAAL